MQPPKIWREKRQRYLGLGIECTECSSKTFPFSQQCPKCSSMNVKEYKISNSGKIIHFAQVSQTAKEMMANVPYVIGIVELDRIEPDKILLGVGFFNPVINLLGNGHGFCILLLVIQGICRARILVIEIELGTLQRLSGDHRPDPCLQRNVESFLLEKDIGEFREQELLRKVLTANNEAFFPGNGSARK